jgi:hypothetical protein
VPWRGDSQHDSIALDAHDAYFHIEPDTDGLADAAR